MTNLLTYDVLTYSLLKEEMMKQKIQFLLLIAALAITGCGSDRTKDNDADSLMTDSAVMDTADMNAAPADTAAMRIDTISQDSGSVTH